MTDDWHDYSPTFITQVITANIVMWVMRLNIVGWGYFKTQTLLEILHQAEFCAFLEIEHWYRSVGCARSRRLYLIAPQNQRFFRWRLVCVWMVYLHSTCGIWSLKYLERLLNYQNQPKPCMRETDAKIQSTPTDQNEIKFLRTHISLRKNHSCTFSNTTKLW